MAGSPTFGNPLSLAPGIGVLSSLAAMFANRNSGGAPGVAAGLLGGSLFPAGAATSAGLGTLGAAPSAIPGTRTPAGAQQAPFPGYMSRQQQLQLAKQEALAQLQPIIDEYHYQQDQAQKLAQAQAAVAQARGQALANIDQGIAPQIGQNYKQAADSTAGYAKGYGTDLQNAVQTQTDTNNALLDKVSGGVGARQTAPNLTDVLFGTMGKLPADTLQAQGAAFKSAADMRPSTDRGLGLQDASAALSQGQVQQGTLAHQLDAYLKQQPGLVSSALGQIQKDQMGLYDRAHKGDITPYQRAQLDQGNRKIDQGNTKLLLGQVNTLTAQTGTIHALNAKGDIVDTGVPTPSTRREAQSTAANLASQTGTVWRVNAKGQPFQPVDKQGNPIPTQGAANANATLLRQTADSLTRGTGIVYQPSPDGKGVAPMLDANGDPVQTPQGRAADANIQAIQTSIATAMSKQTGVQYGVNPDGSITPVVGNDNKPVPTAQFTVETARLKIEQARVNLSTAQLNQQIKVDAARIAQSDDRLKLASGSQKLAWRRELQAENVAALHAQTAEQQQAWQQAQTDAATKTKSGVIYHAVPDPKGNPVVVPWVVNGKVQTVKTGPAASGKPRPISVKDKNKYGGIAETIASNSLNGFKDDNGQDHPPLTFAEALEEGRKEGVPDQIMVARLRRIYANGSKQSQQILADPDVRFTLTNGQVAILKNGQFAGYYDQSDPTFPVALKRAKLGR